MLTAYKSEAGKITANAELSSALWIDMIAPDAEESAMVRAFGVDVPSLDDMEEIEVSSRLYREAGLDYMTVVVPSLGEGTPTTGPVSFILGPQRLVTVRYHRPKPFTTYPHRADKTGPGCTAPDLIFLGLIEEITGRIADILEGVGKALDTLIQGVFSPGTGVDAPKVLAANLGKTGLQSEIVAKVQLSLLTLERALAFFQITVADRPASDLQHASMAGLLNDMRALSVHGEYLSNRVSQVTDTTLGMINLAQNAAVRSLSVVAVLFLPPTLIASIYGMNFAEMPELSQTWGYPMAIGLMIGSAALAWAVSKWKGWL
jgi:magnesium transporter